MPNNNLPHRPRFQFSIAALLLLTTITCILLVLATSAFSAILVSLFVWIILYILPSVLLIAAIYGRGDVQAFAIGALIPVIPVVVRGPAIATSITGIVQTLVTVAVTGGICGAAAAVTRRWLIANDSD